MRKLAFVPAWIAAAAAFAADPASAERLKPYSVRSARHGGTVMSAFDPPADAAVRDLRQAPITVRVAGDVAASFDAHTRGLRIHRSGLRARYVAPKRAAGRIAKFSVSVVAGSFSVSLRGDRIDSRRPPLVELGLGGHRYEFDPAFPDGPPPAVVPLPPGPVEFSTCTRSKASFTSAVASTVIRSQTELTQFLATVTASADDIAVLRQNDYANRMVLVAFGTGAAQGDVPLAVRITNVESGEDLLSVSYDQFVPAAPVAGGTTGGPARSAFFHAVAVPTSGMPVRFTGTPVATLNPWN